MSRILACRPQLALLLLAMILATSVAAESRAAPPLYAARAPGLTVFLFGSLHVLPVNLHWQTAELRRAFDSADQYCFETSFQQATEEFDHVLVREGFSKGKKLWRYLSAEQEAQLNAELGKTDVPVGTGDLMAMRPWAAAFTLRALLWQRAGLLGPSPDTVLQQDALRTRRSIFLLETVQQTVHREADLPDEVAADQLRDLLPRLDKIGDEAKTMVASWMAGDLRRLESQSRFVLTKQSSELLAAQNTNWAAFLNPRPHIGPTIFVAIGIEHLVGPNNMRDLLAKAGFNVERIQ